MWRLQCRFSRNAGSIELPHPCRGYTRNRICNIRPTVYNGFYKRARMPKQQKTKPYGTFRVKKLAAPSTRRCLPVDFNSYFYEDQEEDDPWRVDFKVGDKVEVNFHKPVYPWSRGGFLIPRNWLDCEVTGVSEDLSLVDVNTANNVSVVLNSSNLRKCIKDNQSPRPAIQQIKNCPPICLYQYVRSLYKVMVVGSSNTCYRSITRLVGL